MQSAASQPGLPAHPEQTEAPPPFVPARAFAAAIGVSRFTVYRRFRQGIFPGRKFGPSIGILPEFVADLFAEINSGRPVDVDAFAVSWQAARAEAVAS